MKIFLVFLASVFALSEFRDAHTELGEAFRGFIDGLRGDETTPTICT